MAEIKARWNESSAWEWYRSLRTEERIKAIIFGSFSSIKYDLQYGSVEQMLIAHLKDVDIPICCGFPVGSNSCIPLIEGAPCSLDVTGTHAILTYTGVPPKNGGNGLAPRGQTLYEFDPASQKLIKENDDFA